MSQLEQAHELPDKPTLLTDREIAEYLRVSYWTVRRLRDQRILTGSLFIARKWRTPIERVHDAMRAMER